jgi:hypothetical protein
MAVRHYGGRGTRHFARRTAGGGISKPDIPGGLIPYGESSQTTGMMPPVGGPAPGPMQESTQGPGPQNLSSDQFQGYLDQMSPDVSGQWGISGDGGPIGIGVAGAGGAGT